MSMSSIEELLVHVIFYPVVTLAAFVVGWTFGGRYAEYEISRLRKIIRHLGARTG